MHEHDSTTLPIHPRTGLSAVGIVGGRPVWPILGGSGEGEGSEGGGDGGQGGGGTTTVTFQPPSSQADLDRIVQDRLGRLQKQYGMTPEEAKAAKDRVSSLENDLSSETEKAVKAAREEARKEALAESNPRAVRAEFRAAAKGVLSADQTSELMDLLGDMDLSKYIDETGDVDEEKIANRIAKLFPSTKDTSKKPPRQLGQGNHDSAPISARDLGRAEAEKRFGKK